MVIIILLLIVIIAIPICIRMSHHSRLNNRSVTETAHLIAKDVYSEAQEYAAAHGLDLDRDIVSFYVGTQGISIQYLDGVQQILYIDLGYSIDTLNGCDLKLLRINQSIVEKFGSDKWAVRIVTESGKLIPEEDLRVKIHHSDWYSFVSFKCGSKDICSPRISPHCISILCLCEGVFGFLRRGITSLLYLRTATIFNCRCEVA